jgi:hypothetical protein
MGIDISAYSGLTKIVNPGSERDDLVLLTDNTDFPGRIAPQTEGHYSVEDSIDVLSMGYGSYNRWRDWLAKLAGWDNANDCWNATEGPFWELINFSDCEGTIGTDACQKLLKDFNDYAERAHANTTGFEYEHYDDVHEGLKLAAQDGALKFS